MVAQALVIKDKFANRCWELLALPQAFQPSSLFGHTIWCSRTHSLDRIGSGTEFMGGDMRHRRSLGRSIGGVARCPAQIACSGMSMARRRTGLRHDDLATRPGTCQGKCLARALISRSDCLEEGQGMLGACLAHTARS